MRSVIFYCVALKSQHWSNLKPNLFQFIFQTKGIENERIYIAEMRKLGNIAQQLEFDLQL